MTDDTNVTYIRLVCKTLDTIEAGIRASHWPPPASVSDLDCILCALIDDMIYKHVFILGLVSSCMLHGDTFFRI